ncbi:hypothetical protein ADIS_4847 [Lunatimonas lonarensis]|uniref:Uncharacterized protein n=1 Tax=Lunatimonas lonarensis TaxID=1232681 RepID=R7ZKW0_9BACT|nr:hypothetical protein ADIS_4847 [Lunatimonas lonarensis]
MKPLANIFKHWLTFPLCGGSSFVILTSHPVPSSSKWLVNGD